MYRTVAQLDSVMELLALFFPQLCSRVELPNRSVQGRPVYAARLHAGSASNRRGVLIVGGMHARELMNPDAIVELQLDLVRAYLNETGLTYGGRSWSALDIKVLLESLDIWLLPCANPDGREYVLTTDDMWRQNRRDNPGTTCDGVDVNRNFDFVWGVTTTNTSCNPCLETFVGPGAFSEPEARNVKDLCDAHRIEVFCDVHSYSELVLYPWGHAPTQTTDPTKRFTGLATGTCAPLNPAGHQEYMPPRDLLRFQTVAGRVVDAIKAVRGRNYTPKSIRELYATTGSSTDYVYGRHIANPALRKTYGFAFETGPFDQNLANSFHPADPTLIKRDTKAGLLALLQQSVCAIDLIGGAFLRRATGVQAMRDVRDRVLATTPAGREWIALFERVQTSVLGVVLADESLLRRVVLLLERALQMLDTEKAIVDEEDVKEGLALLDSMAGRGLPRGVTRDLSTIREQLERTRGKRLAAVLEDLLLPRAPVGTRKTSGSRSSRRARKTTRKRKRRTS